MYIYMYIYIGSFMYLFVVFMYTMLVDPRMQQLVCYIGVLHLLQLTIRYVTKLLN